ncbi:MAG TPA: GNAT family N-acetyltransferase [Candidatus Deferrimicrobium sp.]|nr:GNAT family N-acetyltransferase [Candidatus Deferrimicrobium sp.]
MDLRILDSVDYNTIGKLLYDSYIPQWGSAGSPMWSPKYIEYLDKTYIKPGNGPCVGAFDGNTLVGVGFGFTHKLIISEVGTIPAMCICNLGVLPTYQRKGIATNIIKKLEEAAVNKGIKLVYRTCNDELNDFRVLTKCGYISKISNANQYARIMGSEMINTTATLKGMGKAMKLLLKTVAGFPKEKDKIEQGILRPGDPKDVKSCLEIVNSYKDSVPITRLWSENDLKSFMETLNIRDEKTFIPFFYVWDVNGTVKAFVAGRIEAINYKAGIGRSVIIIHTGFSGELERKDKSSFIVSALYEFKNSEPEAFATNLANGHHEEKAFDKVGFNNDRSTRPVYVKVLADDLQEWVQTNWKYKTYYLPYQR